MVRDLVTDVERAIAYVNDDRLDSLIPRGRRIHDALTFLGIAPRPVIGKARSDLYEALREVTAVAKWYSQGADPQRLPDVRDGWLTRATAALARVDGEAIPVTPSTSSPAGEANPERPS